MCDANKKEISLVSPLKFSFLDVAVRIATKKFTKPFGGKRVLVTGLFPKCHNTHKGDFLQLPCIFAENRAAPYPIYTTLLWGQMFTGEFSLRLRKKGRTLFLTKIMRQEEKTFMEVFLLNTHETDTVTCAHLGAVSRGLGHLERKTPSL